VSDAFATRNDLAPTVRGEMIALLNARLADALDLYTQTKHAHWNVKGPQFIALHELYDTLAEGLLAHVDDIAERATALGGVALGTLRRAAGATSLPEFPDEAFSGPATLEALAERYAAFGAAVRSGIDAAADSGDQDTADLFTEVSRAVDKNLWFIEAHLQGG
jgi:starvation-inducible DNA-binding protein